MPSPKSAPYFVTAAGLSILAVISASAADLFNTPAGQKSLEMVPVRNPSNVAGKRYHSTGSGSMSYAYNIGKYEATTGQQTKFLNKVARTAV